MPVRVRTAALLEMLGDLAHTAAQDPDAGAISGILLHTSRGPYGDDPGHTDLLVGASTDRFIAGHTYTPCTGQLTRPTLWTLRDVKALIAVFKPAAKRDKLHGVDITRDGTLITVAEDPDLFNEALSLSFAETSISSAYPAAAMYRAITNPTAAVVQDRDGVLVEALPRTDLGGTKLAAFAKVAASRAGIVQLYRTHQDETIRVQIGDHYRGALLPVRYTPARDESGPSADVHAPDLGFLDTEETA